jgi:hypothetical protein
MEVCSHLAEQTVDVEAHGAGELIDIVLKEAPALAVRGLAVVAESAAGLREGDAQVQEALVVLRGQKLPDTPWSLRPPQRSSLHPPTLQLYCSPKLCLHPTLKQG